MKLLPFIFVCILLSGCQSLTVKESVVKPAEVLRHAQFTVPYKATRQLRSGIEYQVVLSILIDQSGKINSISVTKSSGNSALDRSAIRDARSMVFKAGTRDNKFIVSKAILPITYVIP